MRVGDKPLAGAPVTLYPIAEVAVEPVRVFTDAKGRYEARGLYAMRYAVSVEGLWPRLRPAGAERMHHEGGRTTFADLANDRSATIDVPLVLAPLVSGRVTDAEGKPVADAQVQVVLAGRSSLDFAHEPFARTSAEGRYSLTAPPFDPSEMAQVIVRRRAHSPVRSKPFQFGAEGKRVDVVLPKFEPVTVRVTDAAGKGVPNATIAFRPTEEGPAFLDLEILFLPLFAAGLLHTNEAGEALLHLAPASYDFAAKAEGFQLRTLEERSVARATTIAIALEQAYTIHGRVHRGDRGVADVQVVIDRREREPQIKTGADGTFRITGLARGKYTLRVVKPEELIERTVEVDAPGRVEIDLPPVGTLRARVLDAVTREPVQQFMYEVEPVEPSDARRRGDPGRTEMQNNGTFTVTVATGRYRVFANAAGYAKSRPQEVLITEREPVEVEILLDRGFTVTGRVVDEAGTPLGEASVYIVNVEANELTARSSTRVAPGNARTGSDGAFSISGIDPGEFTVTVRRQGFVAYRKTHHTNSAAPLEIRLERGLTLSGIVQRAGKPLAEVDVSATTAASGGDHQSARTDAHGRFQLHGLIAARYTLHAYRDEISREVRDVDPSQKREIVVNLDPEPRGILFGTVTGLPRDLAGKITRRVVFVQGEQGGVEGQIDEAGNYRIEDAPVGGMWVVARLETPLAIRSSTRKRVEVAAGQAQRVDLDLSAALTVRGRVTLEGRPLASARVIFMTDENSIGSSAPTRNDGSYEISLPTPGTYRVMAHAEMTDMRNYDSIREIRGNETIDIDIREQAIEGVVVDAKTRAPIAGAVITLAPEARTEWYAGETISDANGRFRLVTAASGTHRAIASAPGYAHRTQSLNLGVTENPQLAFELTPAEDLRIHVVDARSGAALEAHLVLETLEGLPLPVRLRRTADGGSFTFSVAPGKYRVTAIVHGYASKKVDVTAPGTITIALE